MKCNKVFAELCRYFSLPTPTPKLEMIGCIFFIISGECAPRKPPPPGPHLPHLEPIYIFNFAQDQVFNG